MRADGRGLIGHAGAVLLRRLADRVGLTGETRRADSGLRRVVTAWSEPDTFVAGAEGTEFLEEADVTVIALPEYANAAQAPNLHLL